jgi:hypothetical protein
MLGHVEGQDIVFEFQWAEGNDNRLPKLADELVRRKPDVIVTTGTPGTLAVKRATQTIPIVFASSGNPVNAGLVASYARPGGNVTGFTVLGPELEGKRVQLLKDAVPPALVHHGLRRRAVAHGGCPRAEAGRPRWLNRSQFDILRSSPGRRGSNA